MQKNRNISKFISVLLLLAVFTSSISSVKHRSISKKKDADKETTQVSGFTHEIVVPNYTFDFAEIQINWHFSFEVLKDISENIFELPYFQNSYFAKLFEHHIAINAP